MRKLWLILFICIFLNLLSAELPVDIDENRFLDDKGNTILEINYQCAYKELEFVRDKNGFTAILGIRFLMEKDGKDIYKDEFSNKIILKNKELINSERIFKDKLSLTLSKSGFLIKLNFLDINSQNQKDWHFQFLTLDENSLLSEIEFSNRIKSAEGKKQEIFQRDKRIFQVVPNHIFTIPDEKVILYYEVYPPEGAKIFSKLIITRNNKIVHLDSLQIEGDSKKITMVDTINTTELSEGYHQIELFVKDMMSSKSQKRNDFFSLRRSKQKFYRIFTDLEDEFTLISYFLDHSQTKIWKTLSPSGKNHFINRFWSSNDPEVATEKNEFLELIKKRINYCNKNFSSYQKGWKTDRGRIYIKHGQPDDIYDDTTGLYTKFAQKEYQIWKYRSNNFFTYVFIDTQTSGNHQLIYADNDDDEVTQPNWLDYLGKDFDQGLLK